MKKRGAAVVTALVFSLFLPYVGAFFDITHTRAASVLAYSWDTARLEEIKQIYHSNRRNSVPALQQLVNDANGAYNSTKTYSVTVGRNDAHASITIPRNAYASIGPYLWPPDSPTAQNAIRNGTAITFGGNAWVYIDGVVNPANDQFSSYHPLNDMMYAVTHLALGAYVTDDMRYAQKAKYLLNIWFHDPETYMEPHLRYAQYHPGRYDGHYNGIIDIHNMPDFLNALRLLSQTREWSSEDANQMNRWLSSFLDWLWRDTEARKEGYNMSNNHATYYFANVMAIAAYLGKHDIARAAYNDSKTYALAKQVKADGSQPEEEGRNNSLSYSTFNLNAFYHIASIAQSFLGENFWTYETQGKSIKKVTYRLAPVLGGKQPWGFTQLSPWNYDLSYKLLLWGASGYNDTTLHGYAKTIPGTSYANLEKLRFTLTYSIPTIAQSTPAPNSSSGPGTTSTPTPRATAKPRTPSTQPTPAENVAPNALPLPDSFDGHVIATGRNPDYQVDVPGSPTLDDVTKQPNWFKKIWNGFVQWLKEVKAALSQVNQPD